jgi:NAD(P)H-nitrite reductase large subunit
VLAGDRLAGAILLGDLIDAARLHRTVEAGAALPGDLLAAGAPVPAPSTDDDLVCSCNGVTRGSIVRAVKARGADVAVVADATGATTGCGGCRPEVEQLVATAGDGDRAELIDVRLAQAVGR